MVELAVAGARRKSTELDIGTEHLHRDVWKYGWDERYCDILDSNVRAGWRAGRKANYGWGWVVFVLRFVFLSFEVFGMCLCSLAAMDCS